MLKISAKSEQLSPLGLKGLMFMIMCEILPCLFQQQYLTFKTLVLPEKSTDNL
jgi:hypothetical protein